MKKVNLSQETIDAIMNGKAKVIWRHTSKSGMTRHFSVYISDGEELYNISREIAEATGWGLTKDGYVKVSGCWMDMAFHMLYTALPYEYARKRNQNYRSL